MFRFGLKNEKYQEYETVEAAYKDFLKKWATPADYIYYKKLCGGDLDKITNTTLMECMFRNVFEKCTFCEHFNPRRTLP